MKPEELQAIKDRWFFEYPPVAQTTINQVQSDIAKLVLEIKPKGNEADTWMFAANTASSTIDDLRAEIDRLRDALESINKHVDSCLDNVNDDLKTVNDRSKSDLRRRLLLREKSSLRQVQITARQALEGDTND